MSRRASLRLSPFGPLYAVMPLVALAACSDLPLQPDADTSSLQIETSPQLAKGGGGKPGGGTPTSHPASWLIADLGIASDGAGAYVDGSCGVLASLNLRDDGQWGSRMDPDAGGGACVRAALLTLAVRHVSDDPHVDDVSSPLGTIGVQNLGFVLDSGVGFVNPSAGATVHPCFTIGRNGRAKGAGLRFEPGAYPASSTLESSGSVETGYVLQTRPSPDNLAYCDTNGAEQLWHVDMRIDIARLN